MGDNLKECTTRPCPTIGFRRSEAETGLKALMENDIVIKYQYEPSDTVDKDCVIRTDPIAGVTIAAGIP